MGSVAWPFLFDFGETSWLYFHITLMLLILSLANLVLSLHNHKYDLDFDTNTPGILLKNRKTTWKQPGK